EGFVKSRPRKGYQIAPITLRDVGEVFTLRVQLEPLAARLAVGRVDIAQLRDLQAACRVQHPAMQLNDQIAPFMDANSAFHLGAPAASGNGRLHRPIASPLDEMSRLVAPGLGVQKTKSEIKHSHNALISAFEDQDGKRAELIA